jgi:RNA polymerase sigma-70 factor (ECF subfamily)
MDVVQDAFLYLLRKFPGFRLQAPLKTILYPVVRHTAIAALQRRRRQRGAAADPPAPAPAAAADATGDAELRRALGALPAAQREVLILRFGDGLSLAEIAVALEVPLGTVKSRLHLGLRALRDDSRLSGYFQ